MASLCSCAVTNLPCNGCGWMMKRFRGTYTREKKEHFCRNVARLRLHPWNGLLPFDSGRLGKVLQGSQRGPKGRTNGGKIFDMENVGF
ncbi:hypothetical protein TNCT_221951 [Trichonephila clavata]|uniref:Uncharacterized protein n=1 Tax=Trichonephila clavata TaxID=2740835 RepID=A0A8X6FMB3_TRICU|nr:hypothetical protein TNCT_221951 [Trichonephila clavata]